MKTSFEQACEVAVPYVTTTKGPQDRYIPEKKDAAIFVAPAQNSHGRIRTGARDSGAKDRALTQGLRSRSSAIRKPMSFWEARHAELVRPVAEQNSRAPQVIALRDLEVRLVHRRALIDHIREHQLRGKKRDACSRSFTVRESSGMRSWPSIASTCWRYRVGYRPIT